MHPELSNQIAKMVWTDHDIHIDNVQRDLELYVCNTMFSGRSPPPRYRRQYYPSKKQIRYAMVKARGALKIEGENEKELEAQAEKYITSHKEEKILYNFHVSQENPQEEVPPQGEESMDDLEDEFFAEPESSKEKKASKKTKVIFCHQTPHQQRLLKRYCTQLYLIEIGDMRAKIPFPLYCMFVQTNVDYQLVGMFILYDNHKDSIVEGLNTIKEWNPGWSPKFINCNFQEEQLNAVEAVYSSKLGIRY